MLPITKELDTILKQSRNAVDVKVEYGNYTFTGKQINSVSIEDSLTSGGIWTIGQCPSRSLSLVLNGNYDMETSPYTPTTVEEIGDAINFIIENDAPEDMEDLSENPLFEEDDTVFSDETYDINEAMLDYNEYPADWTLHPIVVKIGFNNEALDNTSVNDNIQYLKDKAAEGDTLVSYEEDYSEFENSYQSISLDELARLYEQEDATELPDERNITYTYFTLGTFYVVDNNDVESGFEGINLIAYDKLYQLRNENYTSSLTYPTSLSNVISEMATSYGITWRTNNLPAIQVPRKPAGTFREVLQKLALLTGSNISVEPEGLFEFVYPAEVNFEINSTQFTGLDLSDDYVNISKLEIICEGEQTYNRFSVGDTTGEKISIISDFIATQEEVNQIGTLANLPIYYRPYVLTSPVYPQLELGDIITIIDEKNQPQKCLIAQLAIDIAGGAVSESFRCAIPTPQDLGQLGGFSQYIHTLKSDLVYANTLIADKLDATLANIDTANISTAAINYLSGQIVDANQISAICANLGYLTSTQIAADYASLNLLNSSYATIGQLNSSFANVNLLNSSYATINLLNSSYANIGQLNSSYATLGLLNSSYANIIELSSSYATVNGLNSSYAQVGLGNITQGALERLFVDTGILANAVISTASITGTLNSININAQNITAGTLSVERLVVADYNGSTNSIVYQINENCGGTIMGDDDDSCFLHGDNIRANTITAWHIAANTITANEIASRTITAGNLVANTITGNEIAANTITANKLDVVDLSAITANMGTVTAGILQGTNAYMDLSSGSIRLGDSSKAHFLIDNNTIGGYYGNTKYFSLNMHNPNISGSPQFDFGTGTTFSSTYSNPAFNFGSNNRVKGENAAAFGLECKADGNWSFATGDVVSATGAAAFACGEMTTASGNCSLVTGSYNKAIGYYSLAGGYHSTASGYRSIAFGNYVGAQGANQLVIGKYNLLMDDEMAFIIGNGTSNNDRNNALEIDTDGNAWFSGVVNTPRQKTSTLSDFITANSSCVTLQSGTICRSGNVCQFTLLWRTKVAWSCPAGGNGANFNVGTFKSGYRPVMDTAVYSNGDYTGFACYGISTSGVLEFRAMEGTGTARTIAAGSTFNTYGTFILNNNWTV